MGGLAAVFFTASQTPHPFVVNGAYGPYLAGGPPAGQVHVNIGLASCELARSTAAGGALCTSRVAAPPPSNAATTVQRLFLVRTGGRPLKCDPPVSFASPAQGFFISCIDPDATKGSFVIKSTSETIASSFAKSSLSPEPNPASGH